MVGFQSFFFSRHGVSVDTVDDFSDGDNVCHIKDICCLFVFQSLKLFNPFQYRDRIFVDF